MRGGARLETLPFDALDEARKRRLLLGNLNGWLYDEIEPYLGQRILEVGCGHGNLVGHFLDRELIIATDRDSECIRIVRERFGNHANVRAHVYDANDLPPDFLLAYAPDTIVSLNVLEHIEDDVAALGHLALLLPDGGSLVLIVPAHKALYGSIDVILGHLRRYDKQGLSRKLRRAGFNVEAQLYLNVPGALAWFVCGRVLGAKIPSSGQLRCFNRLVPLVISIERRVRPLFGLSLLSVGRLNRAS